MNITDYFPEYEEVGYAKKSYGVNGHTRVFVREGYLQSLEDAEHCFFLLKGCLVPYFIESFDDGLLKFKSCNNPEDTKDIVSKSMYLHKDQLLKDATPAPSKLIFAEVVGYELVNSENDEVIGKVAEVVEYPEQEIAIVNNDISEYMIPLNMHNVTAINQEERLIFVILPEGLLEL